MQTIYYGAPGTGKSYYVDMIIKSKGIPKERIFRTTFHPEYTHSDFVGQLLPKVNRSTTGTTVNYDFAKGVFTKSLEKAYEDNSKEVFLIIEEMSRGDCAGIFGDIFQLLDRETTGINAGYSKYFINNETVAKDIIAIPDDNIKLPPNLNIVGTVNTSDQNVFVMDTAFKRRFEWKYISTKPEKDTSGNYINNVPIKIFSDDSKTIIPDITWIDLYGVINKFISGTRFLGLGEDKQLGQFFIEFKTTTTVDECKDKLQNKLLHYLWNDVHLASYNSEVSIFDTSITCFSDLYDNFEEDKKVFSDKFIECISLWKANKL